MSRQTSTRTPSRLDRVLKLPWRNKPSRRESPGTNEQETAEKEHDQPRGTDFKGPLGLNLLYAPPETPKIDIIFVHGLGGGSRKTWAFSEDSRHYWPKEWLSKESTFKDVVRIHSFGYSADWNEWRKSNLNILDFARSLLGDISYNPGIRKINSKIVLIGHSMGGIVIKKTYMLAQEDHELKDLADRIHTLYFLATPHRGADYSDMFANILSVSYGQKPYVSELSRDSQTIALINDSFRHVAENIQLWSFYETQPCNLVLMQAIIVDKISATLGFPKERSFPLNADHRGICKFRDETESNYLTLRNAMITTVEKILSENSNALVLTQKLEQDQLSQLTGVLEPLDDDLLTLEDIRFPGSCEWFISNQIYKSWEGAHEESRPFFWVSGNPGVGKSVLSSRIINVLQERRLGCSFFFFKDGISDKSTVVGCLRALAYQMAKANYGVLHSLLEAQHIPSSLEKWDARTIWRKVIRECIFKDFGTEPYYWVIDAVDECQDYPTILNLFSSAPPNLRILFTSRNYLDVEKHLATVSTRVEHYKLQEQDTMKDIDCYIKSRMDYIPTGYGEGKDKLSQTVLEKASGSFLWVSLVIKQLEQTYSVEEAEEVLRQVPTDMNELYAKMLERVLQNGSALVLARSMFMWTTFSFKPLRIDGLHSALKLDIDQTFNNLERFIPALSGQFVFINRQQEIETIHQTAKTYLLDQKSFVDLALDKIQCHTRIAKLCLLLLTESPINNKRMEIWNRPDVLSALTTIPEFMDYACQYFSDHVLDGSLHDEENLELLCRFFKYHLLCWIEYLARKRSLRSITRVVKNLQAYIQRRTRLLSSTFTQNTTIDSWLYDLLRLSARFSANLEICPSSIRNLIPAMCPSGSLIFTTYASPFLNAGLSIKGTVQDSWDHCLCRVVYQNKRTTAIACGVHYSAVGLSDGTIHLYLQDSAQATFLLSHNEYDDEDLFYKIIGTLAFSNEDRYLASGGKRAVKVWDPAKGTQLWTFDTGVACFSLTFVDENVLLAATEGQHTSFWDIRDGKKISRWCWPSCVDGALKWKFSFMPYRVTLSANPAVIAVNYRGSPIYLFNITTQKLIGACIRDNSITSRSEYRVDALTFNPNPESKTLIASYGEGELVVYDVQSTQLRFRCSAFADCLDCSPDGRLLLTGCSGGDLQIFAFVGVNKDHLLPLYKISTYDSGIPRVAFSSNNFRFAEILNSEYRVWEPPNISYMNPDEGNLEKLGNTKVLEMTATDMFRKELPYPRVTVMCCSSDGNFVFCGKRDGSVTYFQTSTASQKEVLYRHVINCGITSIEYVETQSLLITADEAGRVLINKLVVSKEGCRFLATLADISSNSLVQEIMYSTTTKKLLLVGNSTAQIWRTEGHQYGSIVILSPEDEDDVSFIRHPLSSHHFVSINRSAMHIYSWNAGTDVEMPRSGMRTMSRTAKTSNNDPCMEHGPNIDVGPSLARFVACHFKDRRFRHRLSMKRRAELKIWPVTAIADSSPSPPSIPLPNIPNLSDRIRQIIRVAENKIFFIDMDLWVCGLEVSSTSIRSKGIKRHFFLLPEWETIHGDFIIDYVPKTHEFIVIKKHELLVISGGLNFAEPWIEESDVG